MCSAVLATFCCDKISWHKATKKGRVCFALTGVEEEIITAEEGRQQAMGEGSSGITSSMENTKQRGQARSWAELYTLRVFPQ